MSGLRWRAAILATIFAAAPYLTGQEQAGEAPGEP